MWGGMEVLKERFVGWRKDTDWGGSMERRSNKDEGD